jgi:hypothetical protein
MKIFLLIIGTAIIILGNSAVSKADNMTLHECQKLMKIASQRAEQCLDALETSQNPPTCQDSYLVVMTENQVDSCNRAYILADRRFSELGEQEKDDLIKYKVYKDDFMSDAKKIMYIKR